MNTGREERLALFEESAGDDDDGGGAVAGDDVLRLGEFDEKLRRRLEDFHFVENSGAVVGDDDFAGGGGDHFVHAFGTERGADGVGDGSGGVDVGHSDVVFAFVVHVGLSFGGVDCGGH
ncbi:hypothetical protein AgCh_026701 [Apium graveolens]